MLRWASPRSRLSVLQRVRVEPLADKVPGGFDFIDRHPELAGKLAELVRAEIIQVMINEVRHRGRDVFAGSLQELRLKLEAFGERSGADADRRDVLDDFEHGQEPRLGNA